MITMNNETARISGNNHQLTLTSRTIQISGNYNSASCTGDTNSVTISGNNNNCILRTGHPNINMSGNFNSIQTDASLGHVNVSGNNNIVTVGLDIYGLSLSGNINQLIIKRNSGELKISGNAESVNVAVNVESITLTGNNHDIQVGGSCLRNVQIGQPDRNINQIFQFIMTGKSDENKITIQGSVRLLKIYPQSDRNIVQCGTIEKVELDGNENRVKCASYGILMDTGVGNLVGPNINFDAPYQYVITVTEPMPGYPPRRRTGCSCTCCSIQ